MATSDPEKPVADPAHSLTTGADAPKEGESATYTTMASTAAGNTAESASNAAVGMKDAVFSMFGGGVKKEKREEEGEEEDRSGSAKAVKAKEAEEKGEEARDGGEGGDVRPLPSF